MKNKIICVDAADFDYHGGWSVDQQFMDQMGSSYLIAHGLGRSVKDAETTVTFEQTGEYRMWVRTKDWVAQWDAPGTPGRFLVQIDGVPLATEFGTVGADWNWQDGGVIEINRLKTKMALHDLTGFDGRCASILFCQDKDFVPSEITYSNSESPIDAGVFELVVVGGGIAGICAALAAARSGLKVALIHDRPILGGNNSSEVRVHLGGEINLPPYPELGNIVKEIGHPRIGNARPADYYEDHKKLLPLLNDSNVSLYLNQHVCDVEMTDGCIKSVISKNIETGKKMFFNAPLFADCSGDGIVGALAGADFRVGREGKGETGERLAPEESDLMTMGVSLQWYSDDLYSNIPTTFPECPWAVQFDDHTCQPVEMGEWNWETGMEFDQVEDAEYIRDYALRVIYGNWAFLKNSLSYKEQYRNRKLAWVAYVAGKRESRRLLGDVILNEDDIEDAKEFSDACVTSTWTIDLHYPQSENAMQFPDGAFRSVAEHVKIKPYAIPYRCLYSRNIENLFMAGRNISVTHVALGTVRVMRTTGMMGEVVGLAAEICKSYNVTPRGVYESHLDNLKKSMTIGIQRVKK